MERCRLMGWLSVAGAISGIIGLEVMGGLYMQGDPGAWRLFAEPASLIFPLSSAFLLINGWCHLGGDR